jgi:hypothetical protein
MTGGTCSRRRHGARHTHTHTPTPHGPHPRPRGLPVECAGQRCSSEQLTPGSTISLTAYAGGQSCGYSIDSEQNGTYARISFLGRTNLRSTDSGRCQCSTSFCRIRHSRDTFMIGALLLVLTADHGHWLLPAGSTQYMLHWCSLPHCH